MITPSTSRWPTSSFQWSHISQTLRGRCLVVRPCSPEQLFQLSSASTAQTVGKLVSWYLGQLWPHSSTFAKKLYISQCLTLTNKQILTEAKYSMLHRILVLICSRGIGRKIASRWCRNSGPVIYLKDGHQGNTSCQGCRCCSTQKSTWSFLTQEEMVIAQTGLCCLLLPINRDVTQNPSDLFVKGLVWCK